MYQVKLNDEQVSIENGRYQIVVAHQRPPVDNWVDTAGNNEGLLAIRYQRSQDSEKPTLKLVEFNAPASGNP